MKTGMEKQMEMKMKETDKSAFLIGATSSGCGKTTFSLGLMRSLERRGLDVRPFKCGPDYIDTQFHAKASGRDSINLDTFMSDVDHVKCLFEKYAVGCDVAIVEGVMGLFDGYSGMKGSSAEISELLNLPVVLLVNAASTAYSVAATIFGFRNFRPEVKIAGVVFNRVSSESHFNFLKEACRDAGVECFGYIRKNNYLQTPSRHLGLTLTAERKMEDFINAAADAVERNVDISRLLEATRYGNGEFESCINSDENPKSAKIAAIAFDEAFNFIYSENLEVLIKSGYEIVKFSPIHDERLPEADFVYLPGGYPELFAKELSDNVSMSDSVKEYVESGGKLWGECGGLIYLCRDIDGTPLCDVFPLHCTMENSRLRLGYRRVEMDGEVFKGHEFHYSRIINPDDLPSVGKQWNVRGEEVDTPVYRYKNALASYTHLYWASVERSVNPTKQFRQLFC